jgi:hypothetical protein
MYAIEFEVSATTFPHCCCWSAARRSFEDLESSHVISVGIAGWPAINRVFEKLDTHVQVCDG